jgi:hypothetical protein
MDRKPPPPVCKAFIVCRQIFDDPRIDDAVIVGLPRAFQQKNYPGASPLGFFVRLSSARGRYHIEVQLRNADGEVVWREGPGEELPMEDPVEMYDIKMNLVPVFPKPGVYEFTLLANDEEVARQPFHAQLLPQKEPAGH